MCSQFQLYRHSTNYQYSVILLKAFNHNEGPKKQVVNSISRRPSKRLKEKHSSLFPLKPVIKCYTSQLKNIKQFCLLVITVRKIFAWGKWQISQFQGTYM